MHSMYWLSFLSQRLPFINLRINNTLSNFARTLKKLVSFLESEGETATNWLLNDSMIVNLHRFQGILLDEGESDSTNIEV